MDPDATLAIIRDRYADRADREQAVVDLGEWLANEGFSPAGFDAGDRQRVIDAARRILVARARTVTDMSVI